MRILMTALVVALTLSGCSDSGSSAGAPGGGTSQGGSEFVLTIGQEVRVDSLLRLSVTGVPADSRCPASVQCVWEGDGAVAMAYRIGMGPSYPDTLHTALNPRSVHFSGYTITLLDLMPYPPSPSPIQADEYAVRLRVERLPD